MKRTRETEADSHLIKVSEGILTEAMVRYTKAAAKVVSEDKETMASMATLDNQDEVFSKGSLKCFPVFYH